MFALLLIVCLILPGWVILKLINVERNLQQDWFFFPAVSLGYFLSIYLIYNYAGLSYQSFSVSYFALLSLILCICLLKNRHSIISFFSNISLVAAAPALALFGVLLVYAIWAGAYAEIPGDPLWHLARITDAAQVWREDSIKPVTSLFSSGNYYWYKFCGWLLYLSGSSLTEQLNALWVINFMVFVGAFYAFSKVVFNDSDLNQSQIIWASLLAVLLLILHFGIGPFSYVRYYAFAPGYFAMTAYWAIVVVIWRYLSDKHNLFYSCIFAFILTFITALLHQQEVMYAILMSAAILCVMFLRNIRDQENIFSLTKVKVCFLLLVVGYLALHAFLYISKVRNFPLEGGWIIPLSDLLPFVNHLYVLKPNWQFFQVLTVFGVWAYLIYFIYARNIKLPAFVVAGMWLPLFTVFNPIFVDLFLRVTYPEVLWRICYVIPVALLMAYMMVYWVGQLSVTQQVLKKCQIAALMFISIVLLLPFNAGFIYNQYHKFAMLKQVDIKADQRQMQDVLSFLNEQPVQTVLTDQVTGYLVNALTEHEYWGNKFYGSGTLNTNRQEIKLDYFKQYNNGLLVLNFRQGIPSEIGRISGHWGENIRNYRRYYSQPFIEFVNSNPANFKLIKQFKDVQVFKVSL